MEQNPALTQVLLAIGRVLDRDRNVEDYIAEFNHVIKAYKVPEGKGASRVHPWADKENSRKVGGPSHEARSTVQQQPDSPRFPHLVIQNDAAIAQVISEYETYSQGLQDSAIRQLRLHARIAGQQVEALVDAGAMVNLLDPTVQQEAGLNEETKRKRLSSVFGDDREVSVVNAVKIECHPKWASTTCFHITPLGGARAILGLPWLTANQAVVHAAPRMESVYTPDVGTKLDQEMREAYPDVIQKIGGVATAKGGRSRARHGRC
ncbi:hypothetical protein NDN08_004237 [Rhodosorus marinus]|uniref:Peptidase A2 domain-containing protein n=1 Tax=Rhodosorus marinus TaxID=101924 RepID=A0AAV8UF98_9RHOD|nr:hypothetical protein NDN08_004237 [Rhodosorus marinus]